MAIQASLNKSLQHSKIGRAAVVVGSTTLALSRLMEWQ